MQNDAKLPKSQQRGCEDYKKLSDVNSIIVVCAGIGTYFMERT